jgi:hypothetical protein
VAILEAGQGLVGHAGMMKQIHLTMGVTVLPAVAQYALSGALVVAIRQMRQTCNFNFNREYYGTYNF